MATRLAVKIGDVTLNEADVYAFQCAYQVNEIPYLSLSIRDGDIAKGTFDRADDDKYSPGKKMTLHGGIDDAKHLLFEGVLTEISVNIDSRKQPCLTLLAKGDAVKLLEHPISIVKNTKINDKLLIEEVAKSSAAYTFKQVAASNIEHEQYAVYRQTPWRIIFSRLIANGAVFSPSIEGDEIINLATLAETAAAEGFVLNDIVQCCLQADTQSQFKEVSATAWDVATQDAFAPEKASAGAFKTWQDADKVLSRTPLALSLAEPATKIQIKARANAELNFRLLDVYRGQITVSHQAIDKVAALKLLTRLNVKGLGATFSQNNVITGIRHRFSASNWFIDIDLGLPLNKTLYSSAASLPSMDITTGKVAAFQKNDAIPNSLPVTIPALDPKIHLFARQSLPFASKNEGFFIPPNIGDEVMIGFVGGNACFPIILGACHNKVNTPPKPYDDKNNFVGLFFDKEKISMVVDREKKSLNMLVSEKPLLIAEEKEGVTIGGDKNVVTVSDKVTITSEGELAIATKANCVMTVDGNMEITASKVEVK